MTTADRAAMLAAIIASPTDDLPRLVYADWLDEHDEPDRAEFIRRQVAEPGTVMTCMGDASVGQMCPSDGGGLCPNCDALAAWGVPSRWLGEDVHLVRRGFVSEVRGSLAAFWGSRACRCDGMAAECMECGNTGRVSGPTPAFRALVAAEPVEQVVVTDREPQTPWGHNSQDAAWTLAQDWRAAYPSDLPPAVFDRLPGEADGDQAGDVWKVLPTTLAASALSAALLSLARGEG